MLTYLALFISIKLAFDVRQYIINELKTIERDDNGEIKIKEPNSLWYKKFLQKTMALITHIIRQKNQQTLKLKNKKKLLKKNKTEQEVTNLQEKYSSKTQLSEVFYALKKYEEFVKQDLTLLIKKASSFLSSLRQKIIQEKGFDIELFNSEFKEVIAVYQQSGIEIEKCSNKFYEYQKIILEQRPKSIENKAIETRLNKIITELSLQEKKIHLSKNKDYTFVENYLKERSTSSTHKKQII